MATSGCSSLYLRGAQQYHVVHTVCRPACHQVFSAPLAGLRLIGHVIWLLAVATCSCWLPRLGSSPQSRSRTCTSTTFDQEGPDEPWALDLWGVTARSKQLHTDTVRSNQDSGGGSSALQGNCSKHAGLHQHKAQQGLGRGDDVPRPSANHNHQGHHRVQSCRRPPQAAHLPLPPGGQH